MIARLLALVVTWVALWGEVSVANIVTGVVVTVLITVLFPAPSHVPHRVRPVAVLAFMWRFVVDMVRSSFVVAWAVLRPTESRSRVSIVKVPLSVRDPLSATVVANAVSLTPGTMTVEIDEATYELTLHVMGDMDEASVVADALALERRVLAAIPRRTGQDREGSK